MDIFANELIAFSIGIIVLFCVGIHVYNMYNMNKLLFEMETKMRMLTNELDETENGKKTQIKYISYIDELFSKQIQELKNELNEIKDAMEGSRKDTMKNTIEMYKNITELHNNMRNINAIMQKECK